MFYFLELEISSLVGTMPLETIKCTTAFLMQKKKLTNPLPLQEKKKSIKKKTCRLATIFGVPFIIIPPFG